MNKKENTILEKIKKDKERLIEIKKKYGKEYITLEQLNSKKK